MSAIHSGKNGYITTSTIVDLPILGRGRGNVANTNVFLISAASGITDAGGNAVSITATGATASTSEPFTSTYNSVSFSSGAAQYLTPASNSVFNVGTGDFTFETFAYFTANRTYSPIVDTQPTGIGGGRANAFLMWRDASGILYIFGASGGYLYTGTSNQLPLNTWHHIALTRLGTRTTLFLNGSIIWNTSSSPLGTLNLNQSQIYIGRLSDNTPSTSNCMAGLFSNWRWIKGSSQYYHPFTTPTSDLSTTPPNLDWTRNYGVKVLG